MDAGKTLELVPMDGPADASAPAPVDAPPEEATLDAIEIVPLERPIPIVSSGGNKIDPYVQQASREYAEGHIDQPLWDRALAQAHGDKTAAAAVYVRARGTALRLLDRQRGAKPLRPIPASLDNVAPRLRAAAAPDDDGWVPPPKDSSWGSRRVALIAAALVLPLVVGGAWYLFSDGSAESPQPVATGGANTRAAATLSPAAVVAAAKAANAGVVAPNSPTSPDFKKKVQDLRDIGNWNVLVLYAVEWTRKEPQNPVAWDQLRMGYMHLRQYDDALNAATKAVTLAPDEARLWRNVGDINLDIDDPPAALQAFEQAVARNSHDVASLQHIALLQTRLGRPQEAKVAFDQALAALPDDATTLCLRTAVGQMTLARDAYTMSRQIKAIDSKCHGREPAANAK